MADLGLERALREDPSLLPGVDTHAGHLTCAPVGEAQGRPVSDVRKVMALKPAATTL